MNIWYGLPAQGITVDEFADDDFDHAGLGFIGGTSLHVRTERQPSKARPWIPTARRPRWGAAWKKFVHENAGARGEDLSADVHVPLRDLLPRPGSRGDRSAGRSGMPHHHRRPKAERDDARSATPRQKMEQWFRAAGAIAVPKPATGVPALTTHAYGGTRMGDNPETNVVEPLGLFARGSQSGHSRRFGDGDQRRAQSDADGAGAGMAHGRIRW